MSVQTLINDLKNNSLQRLYYIYGEEEYLKRHYYAQIQQKAVSGIPEFNIIEFGTKDFCIEDFDNSVNGYPMMSDMKFVGVVDIDNSLLKKEFVTKLGKVLASIPQFTVVVFMDTDLKTGMSNTALLKAVTAAGGVELKVDRPSDASLATWAKRHFAGSGKAVSDSNVKYLLEIADTDMLTLGNEIEKLCDGTAAQTVTRADIDRLVTKSIDANRFDIIDAFCTGNYDRLIDIIDKLYEQNMDDIMISNVFYRAFSDLWHARLAIERGIGADKLASDFSVRPFAAKKSLKYASRMSPAFLHDAMMLCIKLDTQLKSTTYNKRDLIITFVADVVSRGVSHG